MVLATNNGQSNHQAVQRSIELQLLLDNMPCLMALLDKDARYRFANRQYLLAFDQTEQSIQGRHVRQVMGDDGWKIVEPYVRRVLAGESVHYEAPILYPEGPRYTQVNYIPQIENGELTGFYVMALDVHSRRTVEEELRNAIERLQVTLHSITDGVISTDPQGKVIEINPVAARICDLAPADAVGKPIDEVFFYAPTAGSPAPISQLIGAVKAKVITNMRFECTLPSRGDDDRLRQIETTLSSMRSGAHELYGWVIVLRDVSQERELQQSLRRSDQLSAMGRLAGGIAHDFNNVLGGILGATQLVQMRDASRLTPQSRQHLASIARSIRRAAHLTDRMKSFNRSEPSQYHCMDLHQTIHDSIELLSSSLDKRVRLLPDLQAKEYHINGNESEMESAVLNLCINASQAMSDGGTVTVRSRNFPLTDDARLMRHGVQDAATGIEIVIEDEGEGIAKGNLSKIFDPFFTTKSIGLGLGLVAVKRAVDDHGGSIDVRSQLGQGTQFILRFPCTDKDGSGPASDPQHLEAGAKPSPLRILLVEDEPGVRAVAREMLELLGNTVQEAANGYEALSMAKQDAEIDLAIVDINMPVMNGQQLVSELRRMGHRCHILVATGYRHDFATLGLSKYQVNTILRKPYDIAALKTHIDLAMNSPLPGAPGTGNP